MATFSSANKEFKIQSIKDHIEIDELALLGKRAKYKHNLEINERLRKRILYLERKIEEYKKLLIEIEKNPYDKLVKLKDIDDKIDKAFAEAEVGN